MFAGISCRAIFSFCPVEDKVAVSRLQAEVLGLSLDDDNNEEGDIEVVVVVSTSEAVDC